MIEVAFEELADQVEQELIAGLGGREIAKLVGSEPSRRHAFETDGEQVEAGDQVRGGPAVQRGLLRRAC